MAIPDIVVVLADVRSAHNVGSILRTCDGLGISGVYFTGITPYPMGSDNDHRLPHIAEKAHQAIHKTALSAEDTVPWHYHPAAEHILKELSADGWELCALEQSPTSTDLTSYAIPSKIALVVGNEVDGVSDELLSLCATHLEIPMFGNKESFNVSVATAIALFWLKNG